MTDPTPSVSAALYALSRGYPLSMSQNAEIAAHIDNLHRKLAEARADRSRLQTMLCDCFVNAGADTDGSTNAPALAERAVQAVIDLRRDYDENEDWKSRAEAAEASLADARRDAEALREAMSEAADFLVGYGDAAEFAAKRLRDAIQQEPSHG